MISPAGHSAPTLLSQCDMQGPLHSTVLTAAGAAFFAAGGGSAAQAAAAAEAVASGQGQSVAQAVAEVGALLLLARLCSHWSPLAYAIEMS
jgi:hypothetical protein